MKGQRTYTKFDMDRIHKIYHSVAGDIVLGLDGREIRKKYSITPHIMRKIREIIRTRNHVWPPKGSVTPRNTNTPPVTLGVNFYERTQQWQAMIQHNCKRHHLGYYNCFDDAVCARLTAELCLDLPMPSAAHNYVYKQ